MIVAALLMIDLFLVAGQSNAIGFGDAALAPVVPSGKVLKYANGVISDANEPVAPSGTGGAWAAFGLAYYGATGRTIMFVPTAVGGSGQVAGPRPGSPNWDISGTLWQSSIDAINAAIAAAGAVNCLPVFRGILWIQGEADAGNINAGTETVEQYRAAFLAMLARYRAAPIGGVIYPRLPVYVSRTGTYTGDSDNGYAQVRAAQDEVGASNSDTVIVFRGAVDFPTLGYMGNLNHYSQAGYNMLGYGAAANVVATQRLEFQKMKECTISYVMDGGAC